jgi:hypothetical protein
MLTPERGPSPQELGKAGELKVSYDERALGKERVERLNEIFEKIDSLSFLDPDTDKHEVELNQMINNPEYQPTLYYPNMAPDSPKFAELVGNEQRLTDEREKLIQEDPLAAKIAEHGWDLTPEEDQQVDEITVTRLSYLLRMNEKLLEAGLIRSAQEGDSKAYAERNEMLYGKPSKDIFDWTVRRIRMRNRALLARSSDPDVRRLAEELNQLLPDVQAPRTVEVFPMPNKEQFAQMQGDLVQEYQKVVDYLNERLSHVMDMHPSERKQKFLTGDEMKEIVMKSLDIIGAAEKGWKVVSRKGGSFSVSQALKEVRVPTSDMNYQRFVELLFHEVGRHVDSRIKGEESDLILLGSGMSGYMQAEENLGVLYERTISRGEGSFATIPDGTHLAISLARGLDGTPRNFRQTFDILEKVYTLTAMTRKVKPLSYKDAVVSGRAAAFYRSFRAFRGTDGKQPGLTSTRDIIYDEGDRLLYHYLKTTGDKRSSFLRIFQFGKFDPIPGSLYNKHHIAILRRIPVYNQRLREAGVLDQAA